ncbi:uncharacterized protein EI90DRAFT_451538 [Cantharellus anzutake]|uniref:uncharacterized protein n=1 Tax=Cantharellus anzutake TaxID=1750568 RepID=UPI001907AC4B|nr:uncharacterized protein EI90DRAFT_451538 [Cantharellus anzutake]KAF8334678.1 hypothetical protein EI90DRAFT_451538 [Cantharellus anzutake]
MRFWSAFVSVALLRTVAAHFHVGKVTCEVIAPNTQNTESVVGAVIPSWLDGTDQYQCEDIVDNWVGEEIQPGTFETVTICNHQVTINPDLSSYTETQTGHQGPCFPVGKSTSCANSNGQKCTWQDQAFCQADHIC